MPFKITITEVKTVTTTKRGEYTVVDQIPYTDAEWEKASERVYGRATNAPLHNVYDYAPERTVQEEVEYEVLKQRVETLDLAQVIKAINSL